MTRKQFIDWMHREYKISDEAARDIWANDDLRDSFIDEYRRQYYSEQREVR